jgi:hypothetical protein
VLKVQAQPIHKEQGCRGGESSTLEFLAKLPARAITTAKRDAQTRVADVLMDRTSEGKKGRKKKAA